MIFDDLVDDLIMSSSPTGRLSRQSLEDNYLRSERRRQSTLNRAKLEYKQTVWDELAQFLLVFFVIPSAIVFGLYQARIHNTPNNQGCIKTIQQPHLKGDK